MCIIFELVALIDYHYMPIPLNSRSEIGFIDFFVSFQTLNRSVAKLATYP